MSKTRKHGLNEMRPIRFERHYTKHAEGSVLVSYGDTKVLCNATIAPGVPKFLKGKGQAWLTAEYGMLPRATHQRVQREAKAIHPSGRSLEIQRLIGRSLRSAMVLNLLPEYTITIDCDVIQADGGTRTASISGAWIALVDALAYFKKNQLVSKKMSLPLPVKSMISSVSVGIVNDQACLDLNYEEDSNAQTDMNIVMNHLDQWIEIQGTAEQNAFSKQELDQMLDLAQQGIAHIRQAQLDALGLKQFKHLSWETLMQMATSHA